VTRKDYELIARTIRELPEAPEVRARVAAEFAIVLKIEGGYDLNGNRRFKSDRFLAACGISTERAS
jgi:hypothetical protein